MKRIDLDWAWLRWQVGLPLLMPISLAAVWAFFKWAVDNAFRPQLTILVDVTPWALATYCLSLAAMTLRDLRENGRFKILLGGVAVATLVFNAFLVIERHKAGYVAPQSALIVAILLMVGTIVLCYMGRKKDSQHDQA